jgi:hypothetical protein
LAAHVSAEIRSTRREVDLKPAVPRLSPSRQSHAAATWRNDMTRSLLTRQVLSAAILVAGCTMAGTSFGSSAASANLAAIGSSDTVSGTITASLADGRSYRGRYFLITPDTRIDSIVSLSDAGWNSAWSGRAGWGYWNAAPSRDFVTVYAGSVVATLDAPGGARARCKFRLVDPADGVAGGGTGRCQVADGETVDATFAGASATERTLNSAASRS